MYCTWKKYGKFYKILVLLIIYSDHVFVKTIVKFNRTVFDIVICICYFYITNVLIIINYTCITTFLNILFLFIYVKSINLNIVYYMENVII